MGALLGGTPLLGCLMISLLSRVETYHTFLIISIEINAFTNKYYSVYNFSDVNYMNNNDGHI